MKKLATLVTALVMTTFSAAAQHPDFDAVEITTTDLGDGVYMLQGLGGNIGVSIGEDGVFVIDDQFAPLAPKISAAIAVLTDQPVSFLINTHWHADHVGGNAHFAADGTTIFAHDNARTRMAAQGPNQMPTEGLPVVTFSETMTFHFNGHEIYAYHPAPAHTDGDAIIVFRDLDLIHAGDVLFNGLYPFIDASSGGSVDGYIAAMERLAELAGPDTRIISGHGPMATRADVERSIAMVKDARARILALIAEGKTVEEVKVADPLAPYNADWAWSFIDGPRMAELLYNALK